MADYISREAAAQILRKEAANHYPTPFHVGLLAAARAIDAIPAADVRPVVLAHLISPNPYGLRSNCNWMIDIRDGFNFCPNCGADMRETDDEKA